MGGLRTILGFLLAVRCVQCLTANLPEPPSFGPVVIVRVVMGNWSGHYTMYWFEVRVGYWAIVRSGLRKEIGSRVLDLERPRLHPIRQTWRSVVDAMHAGALDERG